MSATSRHHDAHVADEEGLVGDDLTEGDLDALWEVLCGDGGADSRMRAWWADKPGQVARRLLLRLTRAEDEVALMRALGARR